MDVQGRGNTMTAYAPAGTLAMPKTEWVDEKTGKPLNQHERAAAFIRDYMATHGGEMPAIKVIMSNAGVSCGTAARAKQCDLALV